MPELTVELPVWIISQIIGFIGVVLCVWSFQIKSKVKMLVLVGAANIFFGLAAGLLLNWVVFWLLLVAAIRSFAFSYLEQRRVRGKRTHKSVSLSLMIVFIFVLIVAVAFTWIWWLDWVLLAISIFIIYGNYAKGIHKLRIGLTTYESAVIINYVVFFNIVGVIQSILLLGAMVVFYIRFFRNKLRKPPLDTATSL